MEDYTNPMEDPYVDNYMSPEEIFAVINNSAQQPTEGLQSPVNPPTQIAELPAGQQVGGIVGTPTRFGQFVQDNTQTPPGYLTRPIPQESMPVQQPTAPTGIPSKNTFFNYDPNYIAAQEARAGATEGMTIPPIAKDIGNVLYKGGAVAAVLGGAGWNAIADLTEYITGTKGKKFDMDKIFTSLEDAFGKSSPIPAKPGTKPPVVATAAPIASTKPPKEIEFDANGEIVTGKPTPSPVAAKPEPAKETPKLNIGEERTKFQKHLIDQIGFDPVKVDPLNDAYKIFLPKYEKQYGPNANWGPAVYDAFKSQVAENIQLTTSRKQNGLEQLKYGMDMFERQYVPTILKDKEMMIMPGQPGQPTIARNQPAFNTGVNSMTTLPDGRTVMGPQLAKEGESLAIPGVGTMQGQPAQKHEQGKVLLESVVTQLNGQSRNRFNEKSAEYNAASSQEKAKMIAPNPKDTPVMLAKKAQYRQVAQTMALDSKEQEAYLKSPEFTFQWLTPEEGTKFNQVRNSILNNLRNSGQPSQNQQSSQSNIPKLGAYFPKNGKYYKVIRIAPSGNPITTEVSKAEAEASRKR